MLQNGDSRGPGLLLYLCLCIIKYFDGLLRVGIDKLEYVVLVSSTDCVQPLIPSLLRRLIVKDDLSLIEPVGCDHLEAVLEIGDDSRLAIVNLAYQLCHYLNDSVQGRIHVIALGDGKSRRHPPPQAASLADASEGLQFANQEEYSQESENGSDLEESF